MRIPVALALAVLLTMVSVAEGTAGAGVPGLRLVAADADGVTLEYRLPSYQLQPYETPEGTLSRIRVPGLGTLTNEGKPAVPAGGTWVAIPAIGNVTLQVLENETEVVTDVDLVPVYRADFVADGTFTAKPIREFYRDDSAYALATLYPVSVVGLGEETWFRHQRVINLRFFPVRYRAAQRTMEVSTRIVLRVEFATSGLLGPQALEQHGLQIAPTTDRHVEGLYRGAIINYQQGRQFRARARRSVSVNQVDPRQRLLGPQALGTGNPEWKVRIDTTGVWRVDFAQLAAHGWPTGIATDAVTVFLRDTTVNLQPEPWVIREIPVDLFDANGNSQFDTGDYIVMAVQNWADRVQPGWYERRHGDYDVYWISYKSTGTGLRMTDKPGWLGASNASKPTSFPSFRRYERNFNYLQYPGEITRDDQFHWIDGFIDENPIDTLFADLLDLDTAGDDVALRMQWVGNTQSTHIVSAWWISGVGETPLLANLTFNSKASFTPIRSFPPSLASEGVNRLKIQGSSPGSPGSGSPFNWFEVTYPRLYRARNNQLLFNSSAATDTVEMAVDGIVSAGQPIIHAYDVTDWSAPTRLSIAPAQIVDTGGSWQVLVQDFVSPGTPRSYFVGSEVKRVPDADVTADSPSSLYLTPAVDFVIIAHDPFADACQPLADFRVSQGISTLLAKAQDVYDEFNGGRKSHFAIRRFLRYAFDTWGTRFVLLVGDASEDAQGWLATSDVDYLPTPIIQGPVPVTVGFEAVPSDNWYVTRLGPPTANDILLPDMAIGRWTSASPADVQAMVAKSIAYETPPFDEAWRNRAVLIADDEFSTITTFGGGGGGGFEYCLRGSERVFTDINRELEQLIHVEAGFRDYEVQPFYLTDKLASIPTQPGTSCPIVKDLRATLDYVDLNVSPELFVMLNDGAAFVNYQGHANATVMSHEELYISFGVAQDIDLIFNDGRPWVFSGFACHLNAFAGINERRFFGDGLAERMVNVPSKGAIGSFASTAFELLPFDARNHLDIHFHRAFFTDPPYDEFAGQSGARVRIGEAAALGTIRMVANVFNSFERNAAQTYVFLGDPVAGMNFGPPRIFATAIESGNRIDLENGRAYIPASLAENIQIEFDVLDDSYIEELDVFRRVVGSAEAFPDSEITITPSFPDTLAGKRYLVEYQAPPTLDEFEIVVRAQDRTALVDSFVVLMSGLEARLQVRGATISNNEAFTDPGLRDESYKWVLRTPVGVIPGDFRVLVNGDSVTYTGKPDTLVGGTARFWELTFAPEIVTGRNVIAVVVAPSQGGPTRQVALNFGTELLFLDMYAFPNPFRDATTFNFTVTGDQPADILLRVYTVAGRLVYERIEKGVTPGYQQWQWDGRDAAGKVVAHGTYLYKLAAVKVDGNEDASVTGKVVRAPIARPEEDSEEGGGSSGGN